MINPFDRQYTSWFPNAVLWRYHFKDYISTTFPVPYLDVRWTRTVDCNPRVVSKLVVYFLSVGILCLSTAAWMQFYYGGIWTPIRLCFCKLGLFFQALTPDLTATVLVTLLSRYFDSIYLPGHNIPFQKSHFSSTYFSITLHSSNTMCRPPKPIGFHRCRQNLERSALS